MANPRIAPSLAGYVPTPPLPGDPQSIPRQGLLNYLENLSYGIGTGLTDQLKGYQSIAQQPAQYVTGLYRALMNPRATVAAMAEGAMTKARGGPVGIGQLVGETFSPRTLLGVNAATGLLNAPAAVRELDVYHGSPHEFDEFDASKIGTGEGAQAYGHGIYLAENPSVASDYRHSLTARRSDRVTVNGAPISTDTMKGRAIEKMGIVGKESALQDIDDSIRFNEKYAPAMANFYRGVRQEIEALDPQSVKVKKGALYTADLPDEMVDRMLDWDKPFFEQSNEIKKLARGNLPATVYDQLLTQRTGDMIRELARYKGGSAKASELMRQAGIPGIRYLDAGSRGQGGGGTRNFVVFPGEEKRVRILKRE
jgi:hypothetical protein